MWRETQGTSPGHSVCPKGTDVRPGATCVSAKGESHPSASFAIPNHRHWTKYVIPYCLHHMLLPASKPTIPSLMHIWNANHSSILLLYSFKERPDPTGFATDQTALQRMSSGRCRQDMGHALERHTRSTELIRQEEGRSWSQSRR